MTSLRLLCFSFCVFVSRLSAQTDADPALEILHTANALYNRGLHAPAREQFQLFLDRHGRHPRASEAQMGHALCLVAEGKDEEAVDAIRKLANDRDFNRREDMRRMLAGLLLRLGNLKAARDEAKSLFRDSGKEEVKEQAKQIWSEAAFQLEDWKEVTEAADPPASDRMRYQLGVARLRTGNPKAAVEAFEPLSKADGPFAHPSAWLSAVALRESDPPQALNFFRRAAYQAKGAQSADAGWAAAQLALEIDDANQAEELLREFLKTFTEHPQQAQAQLLLGRAYENRNDPRRAREAYEQAMKSERTRHQAAVRRMRLLDNAAEAQTLRDTALSWNPDPLWTPYLLLAEAEQDLEQKRLDEAEKNLRGLIRDFSGHALVREARLRLIVVLDRREQPAEAAKVAREFVAANPKDAEVPRIRLLEAGLWVRADQKELARQRLDALIQEKPDREIDESARLLLAQLLAAESAWERIPALLESLRTAENPEALRLSGLAAARTEAWKNAEVWLEAFLKIAGDDAESRLLLAFALEADGKPERAAAQLDVFVQRDAKDDRSPGLLLKSAQLYLAADRSGEAKERLKRLVNDHRDSPRAGDALAELARLAKADGELAPAAEYGFRLLREHPDHPLASTAGLQAGQIYFQRGDFGKSREALELLLKQHPDFSQAEHAAFLIAMGWVEQEKTGDAEPKLREFLEKFTDSPRRPQALYELAWLMRKQDKAGEGAVFYRQLLATHPDHELAAQARLELAGVLQQIGKPEEALAVLKDADADDPRVRLERAWALFNSGESARAAKAFADLAPTLSEPDAKRDAWFQAGESAMRSKDFGNALGSFEHAAKVEGAETTPALRLRLAEIYGLNGRWRDSEQAAQRLQQDFPKHELIGRAVYQEAWSLENQGKFTEAIERYRAWIETGDKSRTAARCQFQIGECLLALNRPDAAIAAFMQTVMTHDAAEVRAPALLVLADTLRTVDRSEEARKWYRRLIDDYPESSAAELARKHLESNPTE